MIFQKNKSIRQRTGLIKKIATGDESAFRELLRQFQPVIYRFAVRFLGDSEDAKDIAQETFLKFFRSIKTVNEEENVNAFLFMIARNLCIDFLRKKKPDSYSQNLEPVCTQTPLECLRRKEEHEAMLHIVNSLPERQRTAIDLRYAEGFSYAEIASIMNVSVSAVEALLDRGKKELRKRLSNLNN